jgi:hypothetical protein
VGLGIFFASLGANAVIGVYALLAPGFGDTEGKILLTSLCVTGAVLLVLACAPAWERHLLGPIPAAAAGTSVTAFALVIAGVWSEAANEPLGKLTGSAMTIGVAGAVTSLLGLARLARRYRPVQGAALTLLAVAAAMIVVAVWADPGSDWYPRAAGAVLVAFAAFAISIPVLHRLSRAAAAVVPEFGSGPIRFCPYCGQPLALSAAATAGCRRCGRTFTVHAIETPAAETVRAPAGV